MLWHAENIESQYHRKRQAGRNLSRSCQIWARCEVRPSCSAIYPVGSWKPSRLDTSQPLRTTGYTAQLSWWRNCRKSLWRDWLRLLDNFLIGIVRLLLDATWHLPFSGLNKPNSSTFAFSLSPCFQQFTLPKLLVWAIQLASFGKTGLMSPSMDSILQNKDNLWMG